MFKSILGSYIKDDLMNIIFSQHTFNMSWVLLITYTIPNFFIIFNLLLAHGRYLKLKMYFRTLPTQLRLCPAFKQRTCKITIEVEDNMYENSNLRAHSVAVLL